MKKLFIFFAAVLAACSPDDSTSTPSGSVDVLSHSYTYNPLAGGYVYKYTADVRNTTDSDVSGNVVFEYKNGNAYTREYLPVSIPSMQTVSKTGEWGSVVHSSSERVPSSVTFVND